LSELNPRRDPRQVFEDETVAAERDFAERVACDGIRRAFLSVLAEDAMILGDGPEPGRPAYAALPQDYPGRLEWEPRVVAAALDGTLAFTSGPYRLLDSAGNEKSPGVYFSVWKRNPGNGRLELVLDFGSKGAVFPGLGTELIRLRAGDGSLERSLSRWVQTGLCSSTAGALCLGEAQPGAMMNPSGAFSALDRSLGAIWGPRIRLDGTSGAFIIVLGAGEPEPIILAGINA
jgi:hypothetical protein